MNSSEWKPTKWGDLATLEYGKSLRDYETRSGDIPVYGTNGLIGYTDKPLCPFPSIIIGRKGAYRGIHYSSKPFFVIDTAFYLKPKADNVDLLFAYYQLLTQDINSMDSGSAIPSTSREDFYNLEINLPPISVQRRIADILSALDEKIKLNRQTNATLEAIAQSIFREWFVENKEVENWKVGTVGDVVRRISVGKKYDFKTALPEGKVPILDQSHFTIIGYHNDKPGVDASVDNPVLVFSNHRCYTDIIHFPFSAIQNVLPFIGDGVDTRWLYHATDGIITYSEYKGHYPEFISKPLVIPPKDLTEDFGELIKPLHIKIMRNKEESRTLASLRDALLPKLMSREIEV